LVRKGGPAEKFIEVGDMDTRAPGRVVLVRLRASSINPSDYKRAANAPLEFPRIVPHSDSAGRLGAGRGV
jgi:NADPH:quinone reductase-like Zn-dependent oxidoreductase